MRQLFIKSSGQSVVPRLLKNLLPLIAVTIAATSAHAQQSFSFIGGSAGSRLLYFINPTTGQEYRTVDLGGFTSTLGSAFTTVNGLAFDAGTQRVYFATTLSSTRGGTTGTTGVGTTLSGDGGIFYYDVQNNTVGTVIASVGTNAAGNLRNADNAAFYRNGTTNYYYWTQDQELDNSPNLYRINLSVAGSQVETLEDFNGSNTRNYYNFGDIAIDSTGLLHGFARAADGATDIYFSSAAPRLASFSGTPTDIQLGYAESASAVNIHQLAYNWSDPTTLGSTLYGQNSLGTGGGSNQFFAINQSTGAEQGAALFTGIRTYNDLTSAPLTPTPAPPGVVSGLIGIAMGGAQFGMVRFCKRRRAKKELSH